MTDQPSEGQEPKGPVPPPGPPPQQWQQPGGPLQPPPPQQWPQQPPHGQLPPGPPPYGQPPQGRAPYAQQPPGPYGPTYAQRPPAPGLPSWAKVVLGALIGLLVSVGSPLLAFGLAGIDAPVELLVFLVTIIPVLLASPLLIARQTRFWGVGIMLGLAVGSFVLGGVCVSLISGY
ncbi:hypothetical protein ACOCJ5_08815 [Knoellia sp. CPCC 206450]|uniref:hypothetical protein n=1 Tax=Knoellia tibetensis TaxID=3404798 RepID=UPI003B43C096